MGNDFFDEAELLRRLPPMPDPNYTRIFYEVVAGVSLISILVLALVFLLNVTLMYLLLPGRVVYSVLVTSGGLLAIVCLVVLVHRDPGVIFRSPRTCLPLPPPILQKLTAGDELSNLTNIRMDNGDSFCTRCFVWRKIDEPWPGSFRRLFRNHFNYSTAPPHHCSVCNRCVQYFDHHSELLGRCIAGRGFQGNFLWFMLLWLLIMSGISLQLVLVLLSAATHLKVVFTGFGIGGF